MNGPTRPLEPPVAHALETFSLRMGVRRRELGYSQSELASVSGIGAAMVGAFERGDRRPSLAHAVRLADALEVSVGYMLEEPGGDADTLADAVLDALHGHGYARGARRTRSRVTGLPYVESAEATIVELSEQDGTARLEGVAR